MSRKSTCMRTSTGGSVRWIKKNTFSLRRKKRKLQRIARRRNRK